MPPDTERESIPAAVNLPPVFLLENTACAACGAASGLVRQQASYFPRLSPRRIETKPV